MLLPDCIAAVDAISRDLLAALSGNDFDACQSLIERRGQLLEDLAQTQRQATETEVRACRPALEDLVEQDSDLQEQFRAAKELVGTACERLLAHPGPPGRSTAYGQSEPTCVDRKA